MADSEAHNGTVHPRKRRRRRRLDRPALSARLLLDDGLGGEVGVLSDDLLDSLFPGRSSKGAIEHGATVRYVAMTPWLPSAVVAAQKMSWTIVPVRPADSTDTPAVRPHASLHLPASSLALQAFSRLLHSLTPNRTQRRDAPIEVCICDVVPLALDTVYVNLETEALRKLDNVHAKFGRGFMAQSNGAAAARGPKSRHLDVDDAKVKATRLDEVAQQQTWRKAVREALQQLGILHTGDLLPLPLPSHPITHVPPPPAKISACEPVSQGLILPSTRIVLLQSHRSSRASPILPPVKANPPTNQLADDDEADDTSNDTFYSAAEDRGDSQNASPPDEDATDTLESELSEIDTGDLSDDPDDIISLNAPLLPPQSSGALSSFTSATPRPGTYRTNGIATPGSVFSNFTATTARGPTSRSKVFKAQGLLQKISDDLVHPRPGTEDDEEARVFVDINTLLKIGCFSGDWVKVEATEEPTSHPLFGLFSGIEDDDGSNWRPVRVYGLPETMSKRIARYPVHKKADMDRRSSFSGFSQASASLQAYISPVLLANLGNPSHLRLTPLSLHQSSHLPRSALQKPRLTSSSLPPSAKEVTLLKLSTPLSSDRLLQPSLFAALKDHFEQKRRIVKTGDLIGVSIDEALGRAVFQTATEDDVTNDELLSESKKGSSEISPTANSHNPKVVSWFKIGNVLSSNPMPRDGQEDDVWGGAVTVDASSTKMEMTGSEQGKTPPTNSAWQYYLGAKRTPASSQQKSMTLDDLPKPYISALRRRLRELISVATSPRAIHLGLPPIAVLVTSTQRGIGKSTLATKSCEDLGLHTFVIDAFDIVTEGGAGGGDVKTEGFLKARAERALTCGAEYTALLIKHIDALNADRMNTALKEILAKSRVLIATTTEIDKVPEGIRSLFTHEIEMTAPDEGEREGILRSIIEDTGIKLSPEADLGNVAVKTAALVAGDLVDVVDRALVAKQNRLEALASSASKSSPSFDQVTIKDIEIAGGLFSNSLTKADFDGAVDAARKNFADAIGAPKIPNVGWSDVGGLTHVKDAVMETIQLPLSRPELFAKGMKKRSGILFYGPPGTGKTLLAKAIATEFSLNFFSVKGPELLNMYIGESEANVRRVFQRARDARPCVVFFDELDSVAPKRGNQGDSGGVMDRIVSQLLAELDGMSDGGEGVFVIGATNRPDLLDQALLRPGRFDKMLYLGVSDTHEKQQTILEALTRKFTLHPSLSLQRVSQGLPFTYTGADMYALCSDAMLKAITRQARAVDEKVKAYNASHARNITIAYFFDHLAADEDTAVMVTEDDFMEAHNELVPSVSADELRHYDRVRKLFEGAGKNEDDQKKTPGAVLPASSGKGKGKAAIAVVPEEDMVVRTENMERNGAYHGSGSGSGSGKGKGKAPAANHASKSSVDIAEGGFGDATQDDELYS